MKAVRVHRFGGPEGRSALPQPLPLTLGSDLAGTVVEAGKSTGGFHAGDEVYGVTNPWFTGAYARWAVASAGMLRESRRASVSLKQRPPVVAVTAWQMLFEHAKIQPGQRILVLGASGSVGSMVVQLAHRHRAHIVAAISFDDSARMLHLGADEVLDLINAAQVQSLSLVDAVIDVAGGESQRMGSPLASAPYCRCVRSKMRMRCWRARGGTPAAKSY